MTRDRGYRRTQAERLLKKRKKYRHLPESESYVKDKGETSTCSDLVGRRKSDIINHPKKCSCDMCCNPRHNSYMNNDEKKTMPERKFTDRAKFEEGDIK